MTEDFVKNTLQGREPATEQERKGFNDATKFLRDLPETREKWDVYHKPPTGIRGCHGCSCDRKESDCPRCQYEMGFNECLSRRTEDT